MNSRIDNSYSYLPHPPPPSLPFPFGSAHRRLPWIVFPKSIIEIYGGAVSPVPSIIGQQQPNTCCPQNAVPSGHIGAYNINSYGHAYQQEGDQVLPKGDRRQRRKQQKTVTSERAIESANSSQSRKWSADHPQFSSMASTTNSVAGGLPKKETYSTAHAPRRREKHDAELSMDEGEGLHGLKEHRGEGTIEEMKEHSHKKLVYTFSQLLAIRESMRTTTGYKFPAAAFFPDDIIRFDNFHLSATADTKQTASRITHNNALVVSQRSVNDTTAVAIAVCSPSEQNLSECAATVDDLKDSTAVSVNRSRLLVASGEQSQGDIHELASLSLEGQEGRFETQQSNSDIPIAPLPVKGELSGNATKISSSSEDGLIQYSVEQLLHIRSQKLSLSPKVVEGESLDADTTLVTLLTERFPAIVLANRDKTALGENGSMHQRLNTSKSKKKTERDQAAAAPPREEEVRIMPTQTEQVPPINAELQRDEIAVASSTEDVAEPKLSVQFHEETDLEARKMSLMETLDRMLGTEAQENID